MTEQNKGTTVGLPAVVPLYGRDDVEPMLWLQREVQAAVLGGWRPCEVQMRGSLPPLPEPEVVLEAPTDSESETDFGVSPNQETEQEQVLLGLVVD